MRCCCATWARAAGASCTQTSPGPKPPVRCELAGSRVQGHDMGAWLVRPVRQRALVQSHRCVASLQGLGFRGTTWARAAGASCAPTSPGPKPQVRCEPAGSRVWGTTWARAAGASCAPTSLGLKPQVRCELAGLRASGRRCLHTYQLGRGTGALLNAAQSCLSVAHSGCHGRTKLRARVAIPVSYFVCRHTRQTVSSMTDTCLKPIRLFFMHSVRAAGASQRVKGRS